MCVWASIPPGMTSSAFGIDYFVGFHFQPLTDHCDRFVLDEDIGVVIINCGDDAAVLIKVLMKFNLLYGV